MADEQKMAKKISKIIEEEGGELRYFFLTYAKNDKLVFVSHIESAELHATIGMLERAKAQLLKRME